ncbi:MAG: hypothetical protein OEW15_10015 [Nitrospirota bacterium]|nr:hypothetical protein [Nitrospirota bacterium]
MTEAQLKKTAWGFVAAGTAIHLFWFVPFLIVVAVPMLAVGHYFTLRWKGYAPFREPGFYGMLVAFLLPLLGPVAAVSKLLTLPRKSATPDPKERRRSALINAGLTLLVIGFPAYVVMSMMSAIMVKEKNARAVQAIREGVSALDTVLEKTGEYPESLAKAGIAVGPEVDLQYRRTGRRSGELIASHAKGSRTFRQELPAKGKDLFMKPKDEPEAEWVPR